MVRKLCAARGCDDLAEAGQARCALHLERQRDALAERRRAAQLTDHAARWRILYRSRDWRAASAAFLRKHPLCCDCGELGVVEPSRVVDHKIRHKGDAALFWDRSNWQALCLTCHNRKTAREVFHGAG